MPRNEYVLTKTTPAGWKLYALSDATKVDISDGRFAMVRETSPFEDDAYRMSALDAEELAEQLNDWGIGGERWVVQPLQ